MLDHLDQRVHQDRKDHQGRQVHWVLMVSQVLREAQVHLEHREVQVCRDRPGVLAPLARLDLRELLVR